MPFLDHSSCCTQHRKAAPKPIPVPHTCPKCQGPLPGNEWFAYGRCEDCWVGDSPSSSYAGPKVLRDSFQSYDTGGGERGGGQRLRSGEFEYIPPTRRATTRKVLV
jgi:hypothetical protein